MKKRLIIATSVAAFAAGGAWLYASGETKEAVALSSDVATLQLGKDVYAENCASCHGANLEGQPNWRERNAEGRLPAPPHDENGHTWHHDSEALFNITKYGVAAMISDDSYQTDMPIYDGVLSDEEIMAVLSYIRSTWPEHIQQAYDAREASR
ncbi:c-type cytochrome [Falsihalocynthiibacter sp. SS001]|uniref:c-type cytochrome n=1 Tax=Falsihalocynthiibacter sp. SS001 TaxID=3349698 RepID=UPI0036D3B63D